MPGVLPFRGLRYQQDRVELERLVCPPYDVIDAAEQAELQKLSPHNAVHLELPADSPGEPGSRYRSAAQRLAEWRRDGVVALEPTPGYYLAETEFVFGGRTLRRRDLMAALEVEPWERGAVLPHEHTMAGPKADRLELLRATHLNCSPIWVLHRDPVPALSQVWTAAESREAKLDFVWRGERHRVWIVDDPLATEAIRQAFAAGPPLYIADGHHRYETSLAFRTEAESSLPGARAMLAAITWAGDPGMTVLGTHRLLRGIDPKLTLEEVETRWSADFHVEYFPVWDDAPAAQVEALMQQLASSGRSSPTFGVLGFGQRDLFGQLVLRGGLADGAPPLERLDVSVLHTRLVDPLIATAGRPREDVLSYTRDPQHAFEAVRGGEASAALFLNPTPVDAVLAVADAGDRMPEKSTYFYPKPPAGIVMRDLST